SNQITDGMSSVTGPTFSRDGKYLFFSASTNIGLTNSGLHMSATERPTSYNVYAFILSKDTPSLFSPESDEETVKEEGAKEGSETNRPASNGSKDVKVSIDFDNISLRIQSL